MKPWLKIDPKVLAAAIAGVLAAILQAALGHPLSPELTGGLDVLAAVAAGYLVPNGDSLVRRELAAVGDDPPDVELGDVELADDELDTLSTHPTLGLDVEQEE